MHFGAVSDESELILPPFCKGRLGGIFQLGFVAGSVLVHGSINFFHHSIQYQEYLPIIEA